MLLLGQDKFSAVDIRIRVKGGGFTAQIYAIRQAIAKALVAYYQKVKASPGARLVLGRHQRPARDPKGLAARAARGREGRASRP